MQLRKIIKTRGHFPSDEAATKLLYLALRNITAKWSPATRDWKAAANQFAILYADRFHPGIPALPVRRQHIRPHTQNSGWARMARIINAAAGELSAAVTLVLVGNYHSRVISPEKGPRVHSIWYPNYRHRQRCGIWSGARRVLGLQQRRLRQSSCAEAAQ